MLHGLVAATLSFLVSRPLVVRLYPTLTRTGMVKVLNAEALEFTVNALGATRAKLDLYLSKLPPDALREARAELKAEGGGVE